VGLEWNHPAKRNADSAGRANIAVVRLQKPMHNDPLTARPNLRRTEQNRLERSAIASLGKKHFDKVIDARTPFLKWRKIDNDAGRTLDKHRTTDCRESQIDSGKRKAARQNERANGKRSIQIDAQIEKNAVAIRDLIVVSRTLIDGNKPTKSRWSNWSARIPRLSLSSIS
jgi:hypothetical protein